MIDIPKTPFRRVLASPQIDLKIKKQLQSEYDFLNPAELKRNITKLQDRLQKIAETKRRKPKHRNKDEKAKSFEYIFG